MPRTKTAPSRSLTKQRSVRLVKRGEPTLLRAVALEWLKSFDEEKVAEKFDIEPRIVTRILQRPDIQEYLNRRMVPIQNVAEQGARRLLEEALKTALDPNAEWKERTENRKMLARTLLPEMKKISVEHKFIQVPARSRSIEEWTGTARAHVEGKVLEAEIVDE